MHSEVLISPILGEMSGGLRSGKEARKNILRSYLEIDNVTCIWLKLTI